MEQLFYKSCSKIVVVTRSFKNTIVKEGHLSEKISIVFNGCNLSLYKSQEKSAFLLSKHSLKGKFVFGYAGTIGMGHNIQFIIRCAKKLEYLSNVMFMIIGDGAERENVKKLILELNINNVIMLDAMPKDKISEYISIFDVALAPLKDEDAYSKVIPSKIFESAAMGKPVLLGVRGESYKMVNDYKIGCTYSPENEKSFIAVVIKMTNSSKIKESGYDNDMLIFSKKYDRRNQANEMYKVIKKTCLK